MPFEPLRFLHAANLRLDHAIGESIKLPAKVIPAVQKATLAAFDRLISAAIDQHVDFVLLAGNTFIERERSLAARLALASGLERLAGDGIRVFALPGRFDPFDAWRRIPDLPSNVSILDANHKSHAAFKRDDSVVARVGTGLRKPERKGKSSRRELRSEVQRPVPFTIAALANCGDAEDPKTLRAWSDEYPIQDSDQAAAEVAAAVNEENRPPDAVIDSPVDYLALGGGRTRRTITKRRGIAHDPGPSQGNGFRETGPHGCTLVSVETDGTVRCDFVPTASVRWERFVLPVDGPVTTHDLARRCRGVLSEVRWESSEHAWIFEWFFEGPAVALGCLEDEGVRRQFQHELNEGSGIPNADGAVHQIVLRPDSYRTDSRLALDPLHADFCEALAAVVPHPIAAGSLSELRAADRQWAERIESLIEDLEPDSIRSHAAQVLRRLAHADAEGAVS